MSVDRGLGARVRGWWSAGRGVRWQRRADEGFSLVEVMVSLAIIGVVITSTTAVVVTALRGVNDQRTRQSGTQVMAEAVQRVRSLGGGLLQGRQRDMVQTQWASAGGTVTPLLTGLEMTYTDPTVDSSRDPVLPLALDTPVNGVTFRQQWFVGRCWQLPAARQCGPSVTGAVPYQRVVIVVSWPDGRCHDTCALTTSILVTGLNDDPVFDPAASASGP